MKPLLHQVTAADEEMLPPQPSPFLFVGYRDMGKDAFNS